MIVFDHRIEKKIHFSYDKFFFAYAELVRTGRTDVLWSNTKEANKFYECYKKIMDQCKLPLAEAYLHDLHRLNIRIYQYFVQIKFL